MNGLLNITAGYAGGDAVLGGVLRCLAALLAYIIPALIILLPLRFFTKLPSFIFRKLLHIVAFSCVTLTILAAESWQAASLSALTVAAVAYPLLKAFENRPWFPGLFVEKEPGEIVKSMLMLFLTFAVLIAVCWGVFGRPGLCAAAILMWGTGDAAAALIGIPFGKHKVRLKPADGKKSWEGSAAMLAVSFASGLTVLLFAREAELTSALIAAGAGALLGTAVELFSPSEYDTVTVPVVIAAALLALI